MSNLFYEQLEKQSNGTDLKEFAIEELEKIKEETNKWRDDLNIESNEEDYWVHHGLSLAIELIDDRIRELKGE